MKNYFKILRTIVLNCILFLVLITPSVAFQTPDFICLPNPPLPVKLSVPFSTCSDSVRSSLAQRHPDQNKNTPQILKTYDYPFKTYNVTTKDGYILTVYRITGSPKLTKRSKSAKQAVYLNHGLGGASDTWNFQPDSRNLPFKLADAGYEVWLGNCRGSTYSLKHKKYNANIDFIRYWDFSFHEMGIYDVPAVTDKILSETKTSKIFYIGHSMATTQYFVALSELPEMNDKIEAAFLLAPIAYIGHMNNGLRLVAPLLATDAQYHVANLALMGRFQSAQQFRQQFQVSPGDLCDLTATKCGLCDNLIFLLFGYDASQMNNTELPNMFAKIPNNIGVKCVAHYSQNILTCRFQKYDYGMLRNLIEYGSIWAPEYDLQNINAPTYLFYAEQDNLGPPNDVEITARKLKSGVLKGKFKVKNKLFNHADFIIAKDADKLVYNKILSEMKKYKAN